MKELFLICCMALPAANFHRGIISYRVEKSEEDQLKDWLRQHQEIDDVFIHDTPQEGKLKEWGWERVPFTWRGKQIWIKRSPTSDKKPPQKQIGAAA